jgi:hypothetical protein
MIFFRLKYSWILPAVFSLSCAIQVPPQGGERDVQPPEVLSCEPPNYSTGFNGKEIQINFDEYVSLNDINSQLIVSPLINNTPETQIRKKTLTIRLTDTLMENTTYTLNFGDGIVDYNEGNKLPDFQFVFSTGTILDTLRVSGNAKYAFDGKSEKGLLVMLYRSMDDSLPYLERPVYFSKTNDSGQFIINNISPGSYRIIGLKDKDGNYLYTHGEESIGFTDKLIDAGETNIGLEFFTEVPRLRFLKAYSEFPGKAALVFNGNAGNVSWNWITDTAKLQIHAITYSKEKDSVFIWYKNTYSDSLSFNFTDSLVRDSVSIRLFKKTEENKGRQKHEMTIAPGINQTSSQHLHLPHRLKCNHPIGAFDFRGVIFTEDSVPVKPVITFSDSLKTEIEINHAWKYRSRYDLFIPPGTFTDIYGKTNDSMDFQFFTRSETDYGSLMVKSISDGTTPVWIQLISSPGNSVVREFNTENGKSIDLSFLDPGVYRIKLIWDKNGNGKWDTGNYLEKVQPEKTEFYPESITVRANWDVEIILNIP